MQGAWFDPWVRKIHWRRDRLPTPVFLDFHGGSAAKESACNADLGSVPGLGRYPEEGKDYLLQYSGLENFMNCIVGFRKQSDTTEQLSLHLETSKLGEIKLYVKHNSGGEVQTQKFS